MAVDTVPSATDTDRSATARPEPRDLPQIPRNLAAELGFVDQPSTGGSPGTIQEENPEWLWPNSIRTISAMLKNSKVAAAFTAVTMPLIDNRYDLGDKGVRQEVLDFVAGEMCLNTDDHEARYPNRGLALTEVIDHAVLALAYGHMPFEVVYRVDRKPLHGQPDRPWFAHLSKIAPRMPWTIEGWDTTPAGDLESIWQAVPVNRRPVPKGPATNASLITQRYDIEMRRLDSMGGRALWVPTWGRRGGNWVGESLFRPVWAHFKLLGMLWRVSSQAAERQGMGVPKVGYKNVGRGEAESVAANIAGGERAGVAYPLDDMEVEIMGVTGTTFDCIPLIRYHGEAVMELILAGHLTLGHDKGARSLGDTLVAEHTKLLNRLQTWLCREITEGVIRHLVEVNFGPDEPYPPLLAEELVTSWQPTPEGLKALADAQLLLADGPIRDEVRHRLGMPEETGEDVLEPPAPPPMAAGPGGPGAPKPGAKPAARKTAAQLSFEELQELHLANEEGLAGLAG